VTTVEQFQDTRSAGLRLGILAGGLFVVGSNAFVIAGVLPFIAQSLGTSSEAVSLAITWYAIVVAVASPIVSIVLARLSRTAILVGGLVLIAAGTIVASLAPDLTAFIGGRVLAALGGAALVPAATAAAPAIVPAERRGRALAFVSFGFTLAGVIGSPLGTALAGFFGWRATLGVIAALAVLLALVTALLVRGLPRPPALGLGARLSILGDRRILAGLLTALLATASFNVLYTFSAAVTHDATGGSAGLLALLLFVYGIFGMVGNWLGGRVSDRLGSRLSVLVGLLVQAAVLFALIALDRSLVLTAVAFAFWGVTAFGVTIPIQHRLVAIDPARAGLSLSWYSTAMYVGIALAPVAGSLALGAGTVVLLITAGTLAAVALVVFQLGYLDASRQGRARP